MHPELKGKIYNHKAKLMVEENQMIVFSSASHHVNLLALGTVRVTVIIKTCLS